MTTELDYKELLLSFIASLTLADHLGDVFEDVDTVFEMIGVEVPEEVKYPEEGEYNEGLGEWLAKEYGVKTLYGTSLVNDEGDA